MKPQLKAAISLIAVIVLGILFPQAATWVPAIKYLTILMLWIAFLGIRFEWKVIEKSHFALLGAMIGFSSLIYFILLPLGGEYSKLGWIIALAPTAMATPAFVALLHGKVEYACVSVILTHLCTGLILPCVIPFLGHSTTSANSTQMFASMAQVLFIPLLAAWLCQGLPKPMLEKLQGLKKISFLLWLIVLFIAVARGVKFFTDQPDLPWTTILLVFGITAVICGLNFSIGRWIGGKTRAMEASQSLGQKNTTFVVWVAITYMSPFVAMGPILYIFCHNLYNSWQLYTMPTPLAIVPETDETLSVALAASDK